MKCQKCANAATLHITEVVSEDHVEEYHLCEGCAQKYLCEPQQKSGGIKSAPSAFGGHGTPHAGGPVGAPGPHGAHAGEDPDEPALLNRECEICGIKFVDFRNTGRLGCPHDYQQFREELAPLLENIHGETRHCGKTPRRLPQSKLTQSELMQLRKQLLQAVHKEHYEEAAKLRDRIRRLEES
jgi:protein arginine kinase activator